MKRILIVEDEPEIRTILIELAIPNNVEILAVGDGQEGKDVILSATKIHGFIIDVRLPFGSGIEILRLVRSFRGRRPFVIVMSADPEVEQESIIKSGADAFLSKPCRFEELSSTFERALSDPKRSIERQWQRVSVHIPVDYSIGSTMNPHQGVIKNISRSGLFLEGGNQIPETGTKVTVFAIVNGNKIEIEGECCWSSQPGLGVHGFGLETKGDLLQIFQVDSGTVS